MIRIERARTDQYDEIARVWFDSWRSTGIATDSDPTYEEMRERLAKEAAGAWEVYAAESEGRIVGVLALRPADACIAQLFVNPADKRGGIGRRLLDFAKDRLGREAWLRTPVDNVGPAAWYEREGFVKEREAAHETAPFVMAYYRWRR